MLNQPGVYIHFPWCVRKCPYCDFNSHPLREQDDFQHYTQSLLTDWHQQRLDIDSSVSFHSAFLGGGTPSLFSAAQMAPILADLPFADAAEITMEANPGTTEHHSLADYTDIGINRLSIGAQSFNDAHLQVLGRIHSAKETLLAFDRARAAGFNNINIDLMWGLPDQNVGQALADLDAAIALQPQHISWYQLTIEAKTEFAVRTPILPVDRVLVDIEAEGLARLADAGFLRYEVSAFAKPGYQCRHNLNYWSFGDYVGIGAGAHGKISRAGTAGIEVHRTHKPSQPRLYQADPETTDNKPVSAAELPLEFLMNALRLTQGLDITCFEQRTGMAWSTISATWANLVEKGLLQDDRIATTPRGLRYLDSVLAEFLD